MLIESGKRNTDPRKSRITQQSNSQFTRSKLEREYNPILRAVKEQKAHYHWDQISKRRQIKQMLNEESKKIFTQIKHSIKQGRNIRIDWSRQLNFRNTKFPNGDSTASQKNRLFSFGAVENSLDSNKQGTSLGKGMLSSQEHADPVKESKLLKRKKEYLKSRLQEDPIKSVKLSMQLPHKRLKFYTETGESSELPSIKKLSMAERLQQDKSQFCISEKQKIKQAMRYEERMSKDLDELTSQAQRGRRKKSRIEMVQQRILEKSKLTLLKSSLIKQFKDIRERVLEEQTL